MNNKFEPGYIEKRDTTSHVTEQELPKSEAIEVLKAGAHYILEKGTNDRFVQDVIALHEKYDVIPNREKEGLAEEYGYEPEMVLAMVEVLNEERDSA